MASQLVKSVINLYLYGQASTPDNLADEARIRPDIVTPSPSIEINKQAFMTSGGGRFALGPQFELVQDFFTAGPSIIPANTSTKPFYTKQEIASYLGLNSYGWNMQQYDYRDSVDDYADRALIFNTMEFAIVDDARFIVVPNGMKRIENFAVEPRPDLQVPENFDFEGGGLAALFNGALEANIDPSIIRRAVDQPAGIGRKVEILFTGSVDRQTYDVNTYNQDVTTIDSWSGFSGLKLNSDIDTIVDDLWNEGIIKFLTSDNKPILYGSEGNDLILAEDIENFGFIIAPTITPYIENGAVLFGGDGNDSLAGTNSNDSLDGGADEDQFFVQSGRDTVKGGQGNDEVWIEAPDGLNSAQAIVYGDAGADTIKGYTPPGETVPQNGINVIVHDDGATITTIQATDFADQIVLSGNSGKYHVQSSASADDTDSIIINPSISDAILSGFDFNDRLVIGGQEVNGIAGLIPSVGGVRRVAFDAEALSTTELAREVLAKLSDDYYIGTRFTFTVVNSNQRSFVNVEDWRLYRATDLPTTTGGDVTLPRIPNALPPSIAVFDGSGAQSTSTQITFEMFGLQISWLGSNAFPDSATRGPGLDGPTTFTETDWYINPSELPLNEQGTSAGDSFLGGAVRNNYIGLGGNDTIKLGIGDDTGQGGEGADAINGGPGFDTASYASSLTAISLNLQTSSLSGGDATGDVLTSIEAIIGSGYADTITGDNVANRLDGGGGNDTLLVS